MSLKRRSQDIPSIGPSAGKVAHITKRPSVVQARHLEPIKIGRKMTTTSHDFFNGAMTTISVNNLPTISVNSPKHIITALEKLKQLCCLLSN